MLTSINNYLDRIEARIKKATQIDLASLCCFRVVFGLFVMLFLWSKYAWLGAVPDAVFSPPMLSLAAAFREFPSPFFFRTVDFAVGVCTLTLTIGLFTRLSTVTLFVLLIVGNSFSFSLGKIDHSILYPCVSLTMSFQNWGAMFSIDAALQKRSAADGSGAEVVNLSFLAILITFGFLTAGLGKALS